MIELTDQERDFLLRLLAANPPEGGGYVPSSALDDLSSGDYQVIWSALDDKCRSAGATPADLNRPDNVSGS